MGLKCERDGTRGECRISFENKGLDGDLSTVPRFPGEGRGWRGRETGVFVSLERTPPPTSFFIGELDFKRAM